MNWFERSDTASCSVWDSGGNQQPQQPQQKFPLKRVEPALKKCITILQIDIDRLEKHKQNIKKFEVLKDESALNKEQINASLTVQQLSSNIGQLENTRAQVQDSDLAEFDERIQQTHTEACVAVSSFLNIHNIAEQSALQEVSSNRIGPSHPRSLALSCSNDTDPVEEDDAEIEKQVQLYADQNSPSHDSWMKLEEDLHDLNSVIHDFAEIVQDQGEKIDHIEESVESASENVKQGNGYLSQALKLKASMFPVAGAVLGGIVGGPVGFVAGLKLGGLAAIGGGVAGFTGGRYMKKRQEKQADMEMQSVESRRSVSTPEFSQSSFQSPIERRADTDDELDLIKAEDAPS